MKRHMAYYSAGGKNNVHSANVKHVQAPNNRNNFISPYKQFSTSNLKGSLCHSSEWWIEPHSLEVRTTV